MAILAVSPKAHSAATDGTHATHWKAIGVGALQAFLEFAPDACSVFRMGRNCKAAVLSSLSPHVFMVFSPRS
jgi:hypothetical protein